VSRTPACHSPVGPAEYLARIAALEGNQAGSAVLAPEVGAGRAAWSDIVGGEVLPPADVAAGQVSVDQLGEVATEVER